MNPSSTSEPPVSVGYGTLPAAPVRTGNWLDRLERELAESIEQITPQALAGATHADLRRIEAHFSVLHDAIRKLSDAQSGNSYPTAYYVPSPIESALEVASAAHIEALRRAGLDAPVLELLRSWVEVTVDARSLQAQIEFQRLAQALQPKPGQQAAQALGEDPVAPLSAAELGAALGGLGDETVRQRERAGKLFSILRSGRKRGREYPAFQAWPEVAGEALERALAALGGTGAAAAYGFFTSACDLLGGLTPIEALIGRLTSIRPIAQESRALLAAPAEARREAVEQAARAYAAQISA
ncbi:MAG: hypothetical protein KF778_00270 [Rhodocyclaceae bacterium]|nr:hypothetical protein [Rhodocyclaceae bacterium]MBX3666815.1 hypothetical protein [Rhodocyclaceae bacterium]